MTAPRSSKIAAPLAEPEWDQLGDFLEAHSQFDLDSLMGFLSAIVVAPSLLPPSTWLPVVLTMGELEADEARRAIELLMRAFNEAVRVLEQSCTHAPLPADADACTRFALGYVAGAELDPEWVGDADRWTFAAPMAFLAGRRELVPPKMLASLETDPDGMRVTREHLGAMVVTANDSFRKVRLELARKAQGTSTAVSPKVGRNEPCPCGSGKKFKRCCGAS